MSRVNRNHLLAGVAVTALLVGISAANAQSTVTQTVTNSAAVTNSDASRTLINAGGGLVDGNAYIVVTAGDYSAVGGSASASPGDVFTASGSGLLVPTGLSVVTEATTIGNGGNALNLGTSASISISATGAVASVSVSSVNTILPTPVGGFGVITQSVENTASVTNAFDNGPSYNPVVINLGNGGLSNGASVSVSASGAVASVSISSVNGGSDTLANIGTTTVQSHDNSNDNITGTVSNNVNTGIMQSPTSFTYYSGLPTLSPGVENSGAVTNYGSIANIETMAVGSSASISASGAVAAVSMSALNTDFSGAAPVGNVAQAVSNTGAIVNNGSISFTSGTSSIDVASSASISATGAVTSTGVSAIDSSVSGLSFGLIQQSADNTIAGSTGISNTGSITLGGAPLGNGASVSVSATGAVASVSTSGVSSTPGQNTVAAPGIGATYQDTGSGNDGTPSLGANQDFTFGGYTANSGLTVGSGSNPGSDTTYNRTSAPTTTTRPYTMEQNWQYGINQLVNNDSLVTNVGSITGSGQLATGASLSIGASGAVAAYSVTGVNTDITAPATTTVSLGTAGGNYVTGPVFGVTQNVTNASGSNITNTGTISVNASLFNGSSISVSATGAAASVSASSLTDTGSTSDFTMPSISGSSNTTITYTDPYNTGATVFTETRTDGSGGAISYANPPTNTIVASDTRYTTVSTYYERVTLIGTHTADLVGVSQTVTNGGDVTNTGTIGPFETVGMGASVSVAATGGVASVSMTGINSNFNGGWISRVDQAVTNNGDISNTGTVTGDINRLSLQRGASVSISASGAVSSISASGMSDANSNTTGFALPEIGISNSWTVTDEYWYSYSQTFGFGGGGANTNWDSGTGGTYYFGIVQNSQNLGAISNVGTISQIGSIGTGASASISATGAVASVGFTGNNVAMTGGLIYDIDQTANNQGVVANYGASNAPNSITSGGLGVSASASVSATGAVSSVSTSAINSSLSGLGYDSVSQTSLNSATVTNIGRIDLGSSGSPAGLDVGASVSISASGAVSSVSMSGVSNSGTRPSVAWPSLADITQTSTNSAAVTNTGQVENVADLQRGASVSLSASGAVGSVSFSGNNVAITGAGVDIVTQTISNSASISNTVNVAGTPAGNLGVGASVSASATGAVGAVSVSAIEATTTGSVSFRNISQTISNTAGVTNAGSTTTAGDLLTGASASTSATGAVASVGVSMINTALATGVTVSEQVFQDVTNSGAIGNTGVISLANGTNSTGTLAVGSSVSISATGAVASVSGSSVSDGSRLAFDTPVVEHVSNRGYGIAQTVTNNAAGDVTNSGVITAVGNLSTGASASISASGAVAAVSLSGNNTTMTGGRYDWIEQSATNSGAISNGGPVSTSGAASITAGDIGTAASVSVSASGAVTSVGVSVVESSLSGLNFYNFANSGAIQQTSTNASGATVTNTGAISLSNGAGGNSVLGPGSSVSVSASGAVASVSVSGVSSDGQNITFPNFTGSNDNGDWNGWSINQSSENFAAISNTGSITSIGPLGAGASASISATGSVASVGFSANNMTIVDGSLTQRVYQESTNSAAVTNNGTGGLTVPSLANGASASLSATGAVASVSISLLDSQFASGADGFTVQLVETNWFSGVLTGTQGVSQTVRNNGAINNGTSNQITATAMAGTGASVSMSATGAVASVSYSSTETFTRSSAGATFGDIEQSAINGVYNSSGSASAVTNGGSVTVTGGMAGVSSSASISTSGAVASTSYSSVNGTGTNPAATFGSVSQTARNGTSSNVTNSGSITIGGDMALGSSASISATGSAASFSVASINDASVLGNTILSTWEQTVTGGFGTSPTRTAGASITQVASNASAITNSGSISFNPGSAANLGTGASASISATGAAASASFRSVK